MVWAGVKGPVKGQVKGPVKDPVLVSGVAVIKVVPMVQVGIVFA